MIKIYHGSKIEAVNWKIYTDYISNSLSFFGHGTTAQDVAEKLCQFSLFDLVDNDNYKNKIYAVNIDDWKLSDKLTQQTIRELHEIETTVIFALEASSIKSKLINELKIEIVKCTGVTRKAKEQLISYFINREKISIEPDAEKTLVDILPDNIQFIKNEIKKLSLFDSKKFAINDVRKIIFDTGDATIFNAIESWLNNDLNRTVERINSLLAQNYLVNDIIPIFSLTLTQIKFYLMAKIAKWAPADITAKQGLAFWLQNKYATLKPYDKTLIKINDMLTKLYNFDINIKKQKNIPYAQLIKILFE